MPPLADHADAAEPAGPPPGRRRAVAAVLAVGLSWAWYVHFWPHFHAANEAMRLYFVQAVVETGRPELDAVVRRHGGVPVDRSEYGGHVYMDKAPGASLLALPVYPALRAVRPAVATEELWLFGYLATLVAVAAPLLLALVALQRSLRAAGLCARDATAAALATGLASPVLVYASLFFGHGLAAAAVGLGAFLLAGRSPDTVSGRRRLLAGLALGFGGLTDTPVFVLAALGCLYAAARGLPWTRGAAAPLPAALRAAAGHALPVVGGVAVFAAVQLAYNAWVLGHPLRFTYQYKGDAALAAIMATGFLGFRPPQPDALWGLWFGAQRGLLYHAPWLGLGLLGLAVSAVRRDLPRHVRVDGAGLLAVAAVYALLVAGFADWPAGDSAGARHLLPIVPLLAWGFGLFLAWPRLPVAGRAVAAALVVLGVVLHAPTVVSFPYHFARLDRPVLDLAWPLVLTGFFSPSLGRFAGFSDWASFAVFGVLVALPWLLWLRLPADRPRLLGEPRVRAVALAVAVVVAWAAALASSVPLKPPRAVEMSRFQASTLLGPDADERDGNKAWQRIERGERPE